MNYLNLNNLPQQPVPRPFVFNKRNEKIDWRRIAAVDVDRIARDLDFQVLQDNIEQITLCNIDMEVDSRAMDPNFIKLYKMAQLTIEYLLLCQDQITSQLVDYEQIKGKSYIDHDESRRQIEKLKNDLNETKKESKKRKKLLETQQKMLMAQHSTHHTCPVCTHAFLSLDYLQAHMTRRHPEFDSNRKREHDVDIEKENQRLKTELQNKETELQNVKVQKALDEERLRERDETIRQLKADIQLLTSKITILDEKYFALRSSTQTRTPSPRQREGGVKELLKENKDLRTENEQLKQSFQQAENQLKKEGKSKRHLERENQQLQTEISRLNENLRSLQNASGDTSQLSKELVEFRNRYNDERNRRKKLQDELDEANNRLAQFRNQPPPITDRKSPVPPPRSSASPSPPPPPVPTQNRPIQTTEIFLPQYCPSLIRQVNENPRYLNTFRNNAKNQFIDEFEQYDNLGVHEKDTRLSSNDFQAKMDIVERIRQNMQDDLPNFERIRGELSRTLDKLANERLHGHHKDSTHVGSSGSKVVTFKDEPHRHHQTVSTNRPSTTITTNQPKPKYDQNRASTSFRSDDDNTYTGDSDEKHARPITPRVKDEPQRQQQTVSIKRPSTTITTVLPKTKYDQNHPSTRFQSDDDNTYTGDSDEKHTRPTTPRVNNDIQPSPRKNVPSTGINALASGSMRPATITNTNPNTISAIVRPSTSIKKYESDSDSDSPMPTNVPAKTKILDQKLTEISSKGQKPTIGAVPQGFQPSHKTLASQHDDDDKSDSSLTSINDAIPHRKPSTGYHPQASGTHNNHHLSSGDVSQYTYDSMYKSPAGKELRRPQTADSAKTSALDSDEDLDGERSN